MENIFSYIKKNQDISFFIKPFNEIDASIISLLPYLDFTDIISSTKERKTIADSLQEFLNTYKVKKFQRKAINYANLIKLAKILKNSPRYQTIEACFYIDKVTEDYQFGAITFILPTKTKIIAFKGTGMELAGWYEDFTFAYHFPSPAQKEAIKYVHLHTHILDKNIILLGHSKGGNLSSIAYMYSYFFMRPKIKQIYNFDGPGLRLKEFKSHRYNILQKKLIHIVPKYSIIGLLLRHNNSYQVVETTTKSILSHSIFTWCLNKDKFLLTNLSPLSKNLDKSIILWLDKHPDTERAHIINSLFAYLRENNINTIKDISKIKSIITLYKKRKNLDEETRAVLNNFIKYNYDYHKTTSNLELI